MDERALRALANSPMALDVYAWLAQRLHRIDARRPQFITWAAIYEQFGVGYARIRDFREHFRGTMNQVLSQYPAARVEDDERGITLRHSPPPVKGRPTITPRLTPTVEHAAKPEAPEPPVSEWEAIVRALEGNSNVPAPLIDLAKSTPPQRHDGATRAYHKISAFIDSYVESQKAAGRPEQEVSEVVARALVEALRIYIPENRYPLH